MNGDLYFSLKVKFDRSNPDAGVLWHDDLFIAVHYNFGGLCKSDLFMESDYSGKRLAEQSCGLRVR